MPVGSLSGGEQARILMANLMRQPADLLVLDEPTNDLDIPSLEVLEETLADFPGALILVTHDRYMLDTVSTELLALNTGPDGETAYFADYAQWERQHAQKPQLAVRSGPSQGAGQNRSQAGPRLSTAERRELENMEDTITQAEEHILTCQHLLTEPAVVADHVRMDAAWKALQEAQDCAAALYLRWEDLEKRK
jgi:ATP-binding cassette subfamily F protein uup